MLIKQISVFLENKSGRLAEVTRILGENNVDIRALSIADTTDFGILRLIVSNPTIAETALRESGFTVSATHVIAVGVPDKPGGLSLVLKALDDAEISIEYMYAFVVKTTDEALVILRVEEHKRAVEALMGKGINVMPSDIVGKL